VSAGPQEPRGAIRNQRVTALTYVLGLEAVIQKQVVCLIVSHRNSLCLIVMLGAGSIFGPLSRSFFHQRVFTDEISSSALLDVQSTLCLWSGFHRHNSFIPHLPELEHLIENILTVSFLQLLGAWLLK